MMDIQKLKRSFSYSYDGFVHVWKNHQNIRVHMIAALLVILLGFILKISRTEFLFILVAIFTVIIAEMINTSLEEMTNLITREHRMEAKIAKDVAAAVVLLSSIFAVVVGIIIFYPHVMQ